MTRFQQALGNTPLIRVLETLIEGRELDHSLTDIAGQANISWTTLHRIWPRITAAGIVRQTRTIGRAKMFKINGESHVARHLTRLFDALLSEEAHITQHVESRNL